MVLYEKYQYARLNLQKCTKIPCFIENKKKFLTFLQIQHEILIFLYKTLYVMKFCYIPFLFFLYWIFKRLIYRQTQCTNVTFSEWMDLITPKQYIAEIVFASQSPLSCCKLLGFSLLHNMQTVCNFKVSNQLLKFSNLPLSIIDFSE